MLGISIGTMMRNGSTCEQTSRFLIPSRAASRGSSGIYMPSIQLNASRLTVVVIEVDNNK
jgi:hypothetical protein